MPEGASYQVRVEKIYFDSAHFATYGGRCEPLHGHSYQVAAEVEGELTEDSWVVDFTRLKGLLRQICQEIDHRMLLQTESRILKIETSAGAWHVQTPDGRTYDFPSSDVADLPIDNTTAERLAEWFSGRVWEALTHRNSRLHSVTVEVWEGPGQRAAYKRLHLPVA
ncbi:MAG: 6-pyruvoyl tetrahydropterin synthase family protein [Dehalococcoidia bacterium]